jgi:hypothetical protein
MRQREAASQEQAASQDRAASQEQLPLPTETSTTSSTSASTEDRHALTHDSPDDTLGVELKEVFARLAADDHVAGEPKKPDEDDPHEA